MTRKTLSVEEDIARMDNHQLQRCERLAYEILSITLPASPNFDSRMAEWNALYDGLLGRGIRPIREF